MNQKKADDKMRTVFDRVKTMKQCPFGADGRCCRVCFLGPCRIKAAGNTGVCGATVETIAARNFGRMVAAGTAAHSDHAREVVLTFLAAARGEAPGYEIRDERKLKGLAKFLEIEAAGKDKNQVAIEVGEKLLKDFGRQEGELNFIKRAPQGRQELWRKLKIIPRGIDREIVEMLHRTSIGVDQDYKNIIMHASQTALANGWGGSMIATELQDILFGTPVPRRSKVNLGTLKSEEVNIVIHGYDPLLPEVIVRAAKDKDLLTEAAEKGAKGINIVGMCCTGNELLMRHGVSIAGACLDQEKAIITGAVETIVIDVQCSIESLATLTQCFHTKLITTSPKAKIPGITHMEFHHQTARKTAREIVRLAIENYPNRGEVDIPQESLDMVVGFSHESINYILGGSYRGSYRPLNDAIISGRIRGVVGVVGCNNPRVNAGYVHSTLLKELIANDVLVLASGCGAINAAKVGLLIPEAAELAGSGLREVCGAVGIPPVLHVGSCVDNSRILTACCAIEAEGGLTPHNDLYTIPAAACAPEWMSEKAVAIGQYFVASGVMVVFGVTFPTLGSKHLSDFLFKEIEGLTKGMWVHEPDPLEMAKILIERIDTRRKALGIDKKKG